MVLLQLAGVADRHLPAGEVGEARTSINVHLVQRAETCGRYGGVGQEFSKLGVINAGTLPLSWSLRVSSTGGSAFTMGGFAERITFQSGLVDAVRVPERLLERIAPSVPDRRRQALPHRFCGPIFSCRHIGMTHLSTGSAYQLRRQSSR